jgi:DNA-binding response OmpR family regulator
MEQQRPGARTTRWPRPEEKNMLSLVVEDDQDYAEIIAHTLRRESHEVVVVSSARAALQFAERKPPALAVLDVVLPDGSGLDICRQLQKNNEDLRVIFLSSLNRASDVISGLNSGGDDYLAKPFHPSELIARVRSVMRRADAAPPPNKRGRETIQANGLELDMANASAYLHGINLHCTRLEVDILAELVRYPGQALSHAFLTEEIWGYQNVADATLLKGHVSSIRKKLREAGGSEEMIRTVHGIGYSFVAVS